MPDDIEARANQAATAIAKEVAELLDADPLLLIASSPKVGNVIAVTGTEERIRRMPALLRAVANQIEEQGAYGFRDVIVPKTERH